MQDPMLDLTLFRRPAMTGVSVAAFTLAGSIFALFLYITLYVQDDLGYGPLAAGIRFLPITMMAFVVAPFAGKLTVRLQSRYLLGTGLLLVTAGLLLMATTNPTSGWTQLLPGFIVAGAGIGMVNPVLASASVSVVPYQRSGMASGANSTFRQIGIATGIAALGAIFASEIQIQDARRLEHQCHGTAREHKGGHQLGLALQAGGVREALGSIPFAPARTALLDAYRVGFSSTFNELMVIGSVMLVRGRRPGPRPRPPKGLRAERIAPAAEAGPSPGGSRYSPPWPNRPLPLARAGANRGFRGPATSQGRGRSAARRLERHRGRPAGWR